MATQSVKITGQDLTLEDLWHVLDNQDSQVSVTPEAMENVRSSRSFLEQEMEKQIIYGVNTGFGPMAQHIINTKKARELQANLVRSHAVGFGSPLESKVVLAAMIIRLNTLANGYSGVSEDLLTNLQNLINHRIIPVVPKRGAVGTSGDLVRLSHIALAVIGEGEVFYNGKRVKASTALKQSGLKPYSLKEKEGLSLINGTSFMTGVAAVLCEETEDLYNLAVQNGAYALELICAHDDSIALELHRVRSEPGQKYVAKTLRNILKSSQLLRKRHLENNGNEVNGEQQDVHEIADIVQEIYSFRCIPQVLGPMYGTLQGTKKTVEREMNAVTDNPVVDWKNKRFLHGGNFHGDIISSRVDQLKMTLVKLTMLSERRINFFLHSKVNQMFPPFLNLEQPGLTLGLQGMQFVATSTTARNQSLAYPHYVHSIPTNADNQDVVSIGTDSALMAREVVQNAFTVLAIELVTLAQATDYGEYSQKISSNSKKLYDNLRTIFPKIQKDRVLVNEIEKLQKHVRQFSSNDP